MATILRAAHTLLLCTCTALHLSFYEEALFHNGTVQVQRSDPCRAASLLNFSCQLAQSFVALQLTFINPVRRRTNLSGLKIGCQCGLVDINWNKFELSAI
ncbi:hypothetical protein BU23DRAFT_49394 [Bimuria novae-zelandiae CBS 107.79]|uniref:Uncharacterized protein n=1 Tax=Bimuria novae-zelandiae CBS 107.79 TaxID=1447943 RepID=A0A6A5UIW5_9PLEO|nr:hypothetical protein BU23DRAFT_49394 [Bimuria novae-zelandiae CBS 107.79]